MALQQDILTKFGYQAQYIKVSLVEVSRNDGNQLRILAKLFKDQATRNDPPSVFVDACEVTYTISDEEVATNLFALAYKKMKESVLGEVVDKETSKISTVETNSVMFSHSGKVFLQKALDV